jgi:cellulose synthase/poly-beta-1,6-N-acetylglucosamine synthase-like glycosyltransferase
MLAALLFGGIAVVVYTYLGYPLLLWLLATLFGREARTAPITPRLTLLICAYNEEETIARKLENSFALDYPAERLEIMVVSDGCADRTDEIVASYADRGVRLVRQAVRQGKVSGLNFGMREATGEIVVCSDANAMYRPDALRQLVRHFADPAVGMVAGAKRLLGQDGVAQAEGLYWRYEGALKRLDSRLSSVMGATGEIFAIRRALWREVPRDTVIEDFVISMGLVRDGHRVVYDPTAVSEEEASPSFGEEYKRKVRIVAGAWQAIGRLWPLLLPTYGVVWLQYVSHRVLRWTLVPLLLPVLLLVNFLLADQSGAYLALFGAQLALYGLAVVGFVLHRLGIRWKLFYVPFYFAYLNLSALAGAWRFARGAQPVTWEKVRRSSAVW